MITQSTRDRLKQIAEKALFDAGLAVPALLSAVAAFPLTDAAGFALKGDPAELLVALSEIAWDSAAQGQPARLAIDDDDTADDDDTDDAPAAASPRWAASLQENPR